MADGGQLEGPPDDRSGLGRSGCGAPFAEEQRQLLTKLGVLVAEIGVVVEEGFEAPLQEVVAGPLGAGVPPAAGRPMRQLTDDDLEELRGRLDTCPLITISGVWWPSSAIRPCRDMPALASMVAYLCRSRWGVIRPRVSGSL